MKREPAFQAICRAEAFCCAPFEFEAAVCMRDFGLFDLLDEEPGTGTAKAAEKCGISEYAAKLLLNTAETSGLVEKDEEGGYSLTKTGWFLMFDPMTRANFDFSADVCRKGLPELGASLRRGRPEGLRSLGFASDTIYPHLRSLEEPARSSWFRYDHYFSGAAAPDVLRAVRSCGLSPREIFDVGGNTGNWSVACCQADPEVRVTVIDLPEQCEAALKHAAAEGLSDRISAFPADILGESELPGSADLWWMSQFLDCFAKEDVIRILRKVRSAMKPGAVLGVLEPLIGDQPYPAGDRCLAAYSVYFAAIANGRSRFYERKEFESFALQAGFETAHAVTGLGVGHTLLILKPAED